MDCMVLQLLTQLAARQPNVRHLLTAGLVKRLMDLVKHISSGSSEELPVRLRPVTIEIVASMDNICRSGVDDL
jgi:hypothetical protein